MIRSCQKELKNNEARGMCGKGQRVRGDQAEEDITKHLGALLRSAMPVNQELEMIKQKTKAQGEAHPLKTEE